MLRWGTFCKSLDMLNVFAVNPKCESSRPHYPQLSKSKGRTTLFNESIMFKMENSVLVRWYPSITVHIFDSNSLTFTLNTLGRYMWCRTFQVSRPNSTCGIQTNGSKSHSHVRSTSPSIMICDGLVFFLFLFLPFFPHLQRRLRNH